MNTLRAVVVGLVGGILCAIAIAFPASATAADDRGMRDTSQAEAISGASWSAPAYPVDCQASGAQVSCTPTDAKAVTAQECFMGLVVNGASATVCTTYAGHVQAIQAAGGRALLVKYGCTLGDVPCFTFESAGRGLALGATAMMFLVAQSMQFDTDTLLWDAAVNEWSFWQWAILIVTFGAMVWAVAAAVVSGDRSELVSALVRSFIAIPAVPITLWLTGHLLNAVDDMTWYIMNRDGLAVLFSTLQSVMWAGGNANYFFAFLIHGLLMLGMLLLMLVFTFRNIVLAALIMVGPIAWMLFPLRSVGPQWVVRYVSSVLVLLLTGPLTIGFVTLIINGLASVKTIWDPQAWPLIVGLVMVAFAPFAIFGLFSFAGAVAADSIGSRLGAHGGRMAAGAARTAAHIPTRLGGLPSGIRPPGSGPAATGPTAGARPSGGGGLPSGGGAPSGGGIGAQTSRATGGGPRPQSTPASRPAPPAAPTPPPATPGAERKPS